MPRRYRLTGRIETGELAELYLAARDDQTEHVVKLFHARTSDKAYARATAETGAILNPLRAPGVLTYRELGMVHGRLALVRPSVDGQSLGTVLQRLTGREVTLPTSFALTLLISLLEAVQRAHDAGVVHGALTPGNVLLSRQAQVEVYDFGALQALQASPQLRTFASRGRNVYRAPEVVQGGVGTPASDVYSLGAIGYELLTLREAWAGPNGGGTQTPSHASVRREALVPPSRIDRRVHARVDALVLRALEPHPSRRFRSCAEFSSALRDFLSNQGGLPSRDELRHYCSHELYPPQKSLVTRGPVPFSEEFALEPIDGAELPAADTATSHELERAATGARAITEEEVAAVPEDEAGTAVAHPAEESWHAPPGQLQGKRRPSAIGSEGPSGSWSSRRIKLVEDFADVKPDTEVTVPVEPDPRLVAATAPEGRHSRPWPEVHDTDAYLLGASAAGARGDGAPDIGGPTTSAELAAVSAGAVLSPRSDTRDDSEAPGVHGGSRRPFLLLAGGLALVGLGAFAYSIWRQSTVATEPAPVAASGGVDAGALAEAGVEDGGTAGTGATGAHAVEELEDLGHPEAAKAAAGDEGPEEIQGPSGDGEVTYDQPPPRQKAGFIHVTANMESVVYVDGAQVRQRTPLRGYPVRPGMRDVVVEAVATGQRTGYRVEVRRGRNQSIDALFGPALPKRGR